MDPRELLAIQLQRGQATAHKGRQEVSGFGEAALNPGRAFTPNIDALTGKQGGLPSWAWAALGGVALFALWRSQAKKAR